jgi:iron complex outermembrane receptor protein
MKLTVDYCSKWLLVVLFVGLGSFAFAQRTITGTVTDAESGEPLIGANVLVVGTSIGTITDIDGSYSIDVPEGSNELQFSYTGYSTQRVTLGVSNVLDIALSPGEVLEEVVVIGYGTVKKEDATGVVAAVTDEDFNRGAIVSPDQLIAGKVAGVQITPNSGEPGGQTSIRIRGGTSVNASNEPLYVIDGVPIDNAGHNPGGFQSGRNPLNFINPEDIETFTVLKDASATAIYGSRGANGVILITTKKGEAGQRPRISYNTWASFAQDVERIEVLNAEQFRSVVTFYEPNNLDLLGDANTDWQDQVFRTAFGQNHALSLTGGGSNFGYRASVGYLNQDGIVKTSNTERTNFSLSYNHDLFDEDLSINFNVKGAFTNDRISPNGVIGGAISYNPTFPVNDPTSQLGGFFEYDLTVPNAGTNPVSELRQTQDFAENFRGLGNIELDYALPFVTGLSAKLNLGFDIFTGERSRFLPTTLRSQALNGENAGEARLERFTRQSSLLEAYLTYDRPLEAINSTLNFTAGYSYQDFNNEFPGFVANGLPNNFFGTDNPAGANRNVLNNSVIENRLISFFGRVNYDLANRYLLTFTFRRDGSSRFGPDSRWGNFPSAAFGWKFLQEPFLEFLQGTLSDAKLRVGWGITGNQEIGDYLYLPRYLPGDALAQYQFGDQFLTTIRPQAFDPGLQWEETETVNIGLDLEFLQGRFNASIDAYQKTTTELLFDVSVPAGTNLSNRVLTNIGSLENRGIELVIDGYVIDSDDFNWNLGFNAAYNENEITATIGNTGDDFLGLLTGGIGGAVGNNIQVIRTGSPINSFFVLEHILNEDGNPRNDLTDFNDDGTIDDLDMYVDQNGDGIINESDRVVGEQPAPDFLLGMTSNMNYKNFDLSFTLRANLGNHVYNNVLSANSALQSVTNLSAPPTNILTRGLVTNFSFPQFFSDFYVEDASFLRMDNITLGYTADDLFNQLNARLYVTAQNLFVLTDYNGLEPELQSGIDNNVFPRARTILFGLNLNF